MQAKQRRESHFKSSVGSMLNENYGYGYTQNTVNTGAFVHLTPNDLPVTENAIEFLDKKFFPASRQNQQQHPGRGGAAGGVGASSDLHQAYRNVTGQPVGMVHYDRDPFYWPGRERPPSDYEPEKRNSINCFDYLFNNGRDFALPTPDSITASHSTRHSAVSTSSSMLKTKRGGGRGVGGPQSLTSSGKDRKSVVDLQEINTDVNRNAMHGRLSRSSSEIPHDVRFRYFSEDKLLDQSGFKAYSPFTDTSPDFDVKLGRQNQNHVKLPEEKDNSSPIPAPKYSDALNRVLDVTSAEVNKVAKFSNRRPADILKLHGNPEYPSKIMDEKDVPNYVAWAKIYPYCPLTQNEGTEKPQFVPPRGFTPSTPSRPPTQVKLRDLKKAKRNIIDGIKLLSGSSRKRQQQHLLSRAKPILRDANAVNQEATTNIDIKKQALLGKDNAQQLQYTATDVGKHNTPPANLMTHLDDELSQTIHHINRSRNHNRDPSPTFKSWQAIMHDPTATRKVLDLKMKSAGVDVWYSGKTPTRTPSPDSRLPLPADRAWIKHYSPARVQRFMAAAAKPNTHA